MIELRELTEYQARFAVEYARNGGNITAAAKAAGYSNGAAHEIGRQVLALPHVQAAIMRELLKLRYRSGVVGLAALTELATNEKAPAAARVAAARTLCEHAGIVSKKGGEDDDDDRDTGRVVVDFKEILERIGRARNAA